MTVSETASTIYQAAKKAATGDWAWRLEWSKAMKQAVEQICMKINTGFQSLFLSSLNSNTEPMLAECYAPGRNIAGWLMSEKFNGVRCIWDGKNLLSRNGKIFHAPEWFVSPLPEGVPLDGELWMGVNTLEQCVSTIKTIGSDWSGMQFMLFDTISGQKGRGRQEELKQIELPPWCTIVRQVICAGIKHLERFHHEVKARGGEGVVLRNPQAQYEHGRSDNFLKVVDVQASECIVTSYRMGAGKFAGQVRGLICNFAGKIFCLPFWLNDDRLVLPRRGSSITIEYRGLTKAGKPKHAAFVAVRDYE